MDVRVGERRRDEPAIGVEDLVVIRCGQLAGRADRNDRGAVRPDVDERDVVARGRMDARIADQQSRRWVPSQPAF
jgi:hypothetical protein